jgi:hypothetical protein
MILLNKYGTKILNYDLKMITQFDTNHILIFISSIYE